MVLLCLLFSQPVIFFSFLATSDYVHVFSQRLPKYAFLQHVIYFSVKKISLSTSRSKTLQIPWIKQNQRGFSKSRVELSSLYVRYMSDQAVL